MCELPCRCWGWNPGLGRAGYVCSLPLIHLFSPLSLYSVNCWLLGFGVAKVPHAPQPAGRFLSIGHCRSPGERCIDKEILGSPTLWCASGNKVVHEKTVAKPRHDGWMVSHDVLQFSWNARLLYKMMNSSGR